MPDVAVDGEGASHIDTVAGGSENGRGIDGEVPVEHVPGEGSIDGDGDIAIGAVAEEEVQVGMVLGAQNVHQLGVVVGTEV